jgi:hypothetical protein
MVIVATVVGGIERVAVVVCEGKVAVIVAPLTEMMGTKDVIDRTVTGMGGEGVESCGACRGIRPRCFDGSPIILKNGP